MALPSANAPKRERGHIRVAAIMEAGYTLFSEKGYDATTMTEIAASSGTAIGSLYRFFPSKESLADALLLRYAQHAMDGFTALQARTSNLTLDQLADAFVDLMLALQSQRSFAILLVDARGGSQDKRDQFREAMRNSVADVIRKAMPRVTLAKARAMGVMLLHLLKIVPQIALEKPARRTALLAEIRGLVRLYLSSAARQATG